MRFGSDLVAGLSLSGSSSNKIPTTKKSHPLRIKFHPLIQTHVYSYNDINISFYNFSLLHQWLPAHTVVTAHLLACSCSIRCCLTATLVFIFPCLFPRLFKTFICRSFSLAILPVFDSNCQKITEYISSNLSQQE